MNANYRYRWLRDKTSIKLLHLYTQAAVFIWIQQNEVLGNVPSCKYPAAYIEDLNIDLGAGAWKGIYCLEKFSPVN